jgi:predicted transcriptional regulator
MQKRASISLDEHVLARIDEIAGWLGATRSSVIERLYYFAVRRGDLAKAGPNSTIADVACDAEYGVPGQVLDPDQLDAILRERQAEAAKVHKKGAKHGSR